MLFAGAPRFDHRRHRFGHPAHVRAVAERKTITTV
jgi:hypothetical protein